MIIELSNITSSSKKLRSDGMKSGYEAELTTRIKELESAKTELEALYMGKDTEESIVANEDLSKKYKHHLDYVNDIATVLTGTVKTVRLAVETCLL